MGLLNPALLAIGLAIAVPIVLHLFQRHQGPRLVFPALRYLRRAEKESARQIKLRQLLLMLLRVAAILLLALAAARPFLRSGGSGHEPTAVVIVLDNSMSAGAVLGERRAIDDLKDRALATLAAAGPDDRFWLIRAGAPWDPALPGDAASTAARVRETEPTAAGADLPAAIAHARALLAAGAEGRATEIHLLSDLQAASFGSTTAAASDGPPVVVWVPPGETPPNLAVAQVQVGSGLAPAAGERSNIVATVRGEAATDTVRLRLSLDGRVVAAGEAPIGAGAVLQLPGRAPGLYAGWVETDADALRADDRRYFALRVVPPPAVALTGDLPFVADVLAVMEAAGRIRRASLADADVAILAAGAGLESVPDGRTAIVLPPESALELPAVNRRLGAAGVPWRYEPQHAGGESRFALDLGADELARPLERVRLTQVYPLARQGGAVDTVLLRLREGLDWAVRGERERGGRYILIGSPLSATATTLPTSAAMVPLLDRLLGAWASAEAAPPVAGPGQTITLPPGTEAVEWPDGRIEPAAPGDYRLGPDAGIYRVHAGDSVAALLAVNPPPAESDLSRVDNRRLSSLISGSDVERADNAAEWERDIFRSRLGRELWRPALLLVLLLLALEALVAASGVARRDRGRSADAAPVIARAEPADQTLARTAAEPAGRN